MLHPTLWPIQLMYAALGFLGVIWITVLASALGLPKGKRK